MSDRAILFVFSALVVIASLGSAAWLLLTGQAVTVDGLFLLLTCLVAAFSFGLYLGFVIKRAMEAAGAPAPEAAKASGTAGTAGTAKPQHAAQQVG